MRIHVERRCPTASAAGRAHAGLVRRGLWCPRGRQPFRHMSRGV